MADDLDAALEDDSLSLVLVDYFDTLVTRRVDAKQVKRAVARHLVERFAPPGGTSAVMEARDRAERELRTEAVAAGWDDEHRIDDMAERMWQRLHGCEPTGGPSPSRCEFVTALLEIELSVELAAQEIDHEVVGRLRRVAAGCPIVLVSDFHFTTELFVRMLEHHGLDSLIAGPLAGSSLSGSAFVSGEVGLSKASGRLYGHVASRLEDERRWPSADRVLMIGDNGTADVANARANGLRAHHIVRDRAEDAGVRSAVRRRAVRVFGPRLPERVEVAVSARRLRRVLTGDSPDPFPELAATLFYFTRELARRMATSGAEPVFLAREGRFLRELFDHYITTSPAHAGQPVPTSYLVVSRRSTLLAGLDPVEVETFDRLLGKYPRLTMRDLNKSLGFDDETIERAMADLADAGDEPVAVDRLRSAPSFRCVYHEERLRQSALLTEYVQTVTGRTGGRIDVIDVGWKGTIQDHLQAALGEEWDVRGTYLGIVVPGGDEANLVAGDTKSAILFDSRDPESRSYRILRHFKSLYEFLLTAGHGSAASYRRADDGTVEPLLDFNEEEAAAFAAVIEPMQASLRERFEMLCAIDAVGSEPILATTDDVADLHKRMLFFPTSAELDAIESVRHYENFGEMGMIDVGQSGIGGRLQRYALAARLFLRPEMLLGTIWPPLALSAAGFRPLVRPLGIYRTVRERRPLFSCGNRASAEPS